MRRKGIDLLPPRRRLRIQLQDGHAIPRADQEILEIHERHYTRMRGMWATSKPWVIALIGIAITAAVAFWIYKAMNK